MLGFHASARGGDPVAFARIQWDTWSPPGWFDEDEFATTAEGGLDAYFDTFRRVLLDGVGHFPHREAPALVATLVRDHLDAHQD
jgi:pimeloyl-ACP methyl ester carboxylesterase